jgi:hypothetical protein
LLPAGLAASAATTTATARTPATTAAATAGSTAATAAAEATTATAATAEAAIGLGPGFIDIQRAPIESVSIESLNCLIRFRLILHFNEGESPGTAGIAIGHNSGAIDGAVSFEETAYRLFGCVEIQIAYENILHSNSSKQFESGAHRERKR